MLKIKVALIFVLTAASLTLAAPVQLDSDEWELVAKLCGKLERIDRSQDKSKPTKISERSRPIKDARLLAYARRGNSPCCNATPVIAETRPNKSGTFEFKGLPLGDYWFVAIVDQKQYMIPIVVIHTPEKQPVCSQMSFAIEDSGKFDLRVRAPGR